MVWICSLNFLFHWWKTLKQCVQVSAHVYIGCVIMALPKNEYGSRWQYDGEYITGLSLSMHRGLRACIAEPGLDCSSSTQHLSTVVCTHLFILSHFNRQYENFWTNHFWNQSLYFIEIDMGPMWVSDSPVRDNLERLIINLLNLFFPWSDVATSKPVEIKGRFYKLPHWMADKHCLMSVKCHGHFCHDEMTIRIKNISWFALHPTAL